MRERVALVERWLGWAGVVGGALAQLTFAVIQVDEHQYVWLVILGLPALIGGGLLVVAGRMLSRPGVGGLAGQALLVAFAGYWWWLRWGPFL